MRNESILNRRNLEKKQVLIQKRFMCVRTNYKQYTTNTYMNPWEDTCRREARLEGAAVRY